VKTIGARQPHSDKSDSQDNVDKRGALRFTFLTPLVFCLSVLSALISHPAVHCFLYSNVREGVLSRYGILPGVNIGCSMNCPCWS